MEHASDLLRTLCVEHKIEEGHGIEHARQVLAHAQRCLPQFKLTEREQIAVQLAALLHDADDRKFFPDSVDYSNARAILREAGAADVESLVIEMIDMVSCSHNGNHVPQCAPWKLIPRWCDRLEAVGEIGIKRCVQYNTHVGRPTYLPDTSRARSREQLATIVTPERFAAYQGRGTSASMIDHFYDKLLHLCVHTEIEYVDNEMEGRRTIMEDFVIDFWKRN